MNLMFDSLCLNLNPLQNLIAFISPPNFKFSCFFKIFISMRHVVGKINIIIYHPSASYQELNLTDQHAYIRQLHSAGRSMVYQHISAEYGFLSL